MRPNCARRSRTPGLLFHAVYRPRGEPDLSDKARKGGADILSPLWPARHRKARRCGRRRCRDSPILSASRPPRDFDAERRNPPLRSRGCSAAPVRMVKRQSSRSAKSRGSLSWIRARRRKSARELADLRARALDAKIADLQRVRDTLRRLANERGQAGQGLSLIVASFEVS